jgi:hypothetical protein
MIKFKFTSFAMLLALGTTSHIEAAQMEVERTPPGSPFRKNVSPHQRWAPSPSRSPINYKTLELQGPINAAGLRQLQNNDLKEIRLHLVFEIHEKNGKYEEKGPLPISPETINPDVELLSLKVCGLYDVNLERLSEFKKLKTLILDSNVLTDAATRSIAQTESIEVLSLASNKFSDKSIPLFLEMPNLSKLCLAGNKDVTSKSYEAFMANTQLKELDVLFSGMSREEQRKIRKKYKK